jgi:hypothetical protein
MISHRDYSCGIDIPALFIYFFLARFNYLKIDSLFSLSFADNMARFGLLI